MPQRRRQAARRTSPDSIAIAARSSLHAIHWSTRPSEIRKPACGPSPNLNLRESSASICAQPSGAGRPHAFDRPAASNCFNRPLARPDKTAPYRPPRNRPPSIPAFAKRCLPRRMFRHRHRPLRPRKSRHARVIRDRPPRQKRIPRLTRRSAQCRRQQANAGNDGRAIYIGFHCRLEINDFALCV